MTIHLCHQGQQLGDFSREQIDGMLKAGVITDGTLAWTSGLAEWKPLKQILRPEAPPPLPTTIATDHATDTIPAGPNSPAPKVASREAPAPIMENTAIGIVLDESPDIQARDTVLLSELLRRTLQREEKLRSSTAEWQNCEPTVFPPLLDVGNQLPEATGQFGTGANNPIPVNGPVGLFAYLNTLRSDRGRPFAQLYQGTVVNQLNNRIVDAIYLQELTDQSPREFFLFFYLYSTRRSRKLPAFCYRVPMEPQVVNSSWQLGYKQPFMLKMAAIIPLLGFGNASYGAAGVLRREEGRWISIVNFDYMNSNPGFRVGTDILHAAAFATIWTNNLRDGADVLKDEVRLRKLSTEDAENYWESTFGKDGEIKAMGSGATPDDPIVLWPMSNVAAAVIEHGLLETFFGKEETDWIGEERRYPGNSILEYHVRCKNGEKRVVYFDLSRLNDKLDNSITSKVKPVFEKAVGGSPGSVAPKDINCPMYLLKGDEWARALVPGNLVESTVPSAQQPLMTQLQWQKKVREAEIAVAALEKKEGRALPVWKENLRLMKLNPPKEFAPAARLRFMQRVLLWFFPLTQEALDRLIMNDWKAGKPPQLPPAIVSDQSAQDSIPHEGAKPSIVRQP